VSLGSTASFVKYAYPTLTFSPQAVNVGTYTISVLLTDTNPTPKTSKVTLTIVVEPVSVV